MAFLETMSSVSAAGDEPEGIAKPGSRIVIGLGEKWGKGPLERLDPNFSMSSSPY
jgi:hypothetical protein